MIKQSTGEEWENANISLSTAQPDIGGSAPQLSIHYIGFQIPRAVAIQRAPRSGIMNLRTMSFVFYEDDDDISFGQERFRAITSSSRPRPKQSQKRRSSVSLEVTVAKVNETQKQDLESMNMIIALSSPKCGLLLNVLRGVL